mmetsp:Transcript_8066/g.29542  ORF Transcript_8066/g.29542 Transcript_8066/m.29542 type:complete len:314 (-) Transcript_8066:1707-2648(-)
MASRAAAEPCSDGRRNSLELCPRSYDDVERAELDEIRVAFEGVPEVAIKQNPAIGIPGAVYDCSIALAAHVVHEILPGLARERRELRMLELGAGAGACGLLVAAAASSAGIDVSLLLTDHNPKAVDLASENARIFATTRRSGAGSETGRIRVDVERYAFGDGPPSAVSGVDAHRPGTPGTRGGGARANVVLVSDVLYAPESAAPLAKTLLALLPPSGGGGGGGGEAPRVALAWKPRSNDPRKADAMQTFLDVCKVEGLALRAAVRDGKMRASVATLRGPTGGGGGGGEDEWTRLFDPVELERRGLRVFNVTRE